MSAAATTAADRLSAYRAKRDFGSTPEPGGEAARPGRAAAFVVHKHAASRLHWDFRLEHEGVLVSWAVPKGPSLDTGDKRLAVHVEDHPLDYAGFEGTIPAGSYGAGVVEIWDRGTWEPVGDAAAGLAAGELKLVLDGARLRGRFVLIRLRPRPGERAENWLLIKEHDGHERAGADAAALEATPLPDARVGARGEAEAEAGAGAKGRAGAEAGARAKVKAGAEAGAGAKVRTRAKADSGTGAGPRARRASPARPDVPVAGDSVASQGAAGVPKPTHADGRHSGREAADVAAAEPDAVGRPAARRGRMPAGARRGAMPDAQAPQLASTVDAPPDGTDWISEVKFDGYRLLAHKRGGEVRLVTRSGLDWTARLPHVTAAVSALACGDAILDGELVALQPNGLSSFPALQAALAAGRDGRLFYTLFDVTHLGGHDLRGCRLLDRKAVLAGLCDWTGLLRYSDHLRGEAARVRRQACAMGLEGILCKDADAPYRPGRGRSWLKVKCQGREEFVVLGWTEPQGRRDGLGSLHLGFFDDAGALHYAGAAGTGFTGDELTRLAGVLAGLAAPAPAGLMLSEEAPPRGLHWVRPELVVEVQFTAWSGGGRVRHAVYLGQREDKAAAEVVLSLPDPEAPRHRLGAGRRAPAPRPKGAWQAAARRRGRGGDDDPEAGDTTAARGHEAAGRIVRSRPPAAAEFDGVRLTHPDRALWPGVTKRDLAAYWHAVADAALPGIAHRPLAIVRCPDGVDGEHFFQKHAARGMGGEFHEAAQDGAPYLAIAGREGLVAAAQLSAIELHSWGSAEADAGTPDRVVFDLDPGDGVAWDAVIAAAREVRARLERLGLAAFCRTSGGRGLHVLAPVSAARGPDALDWEGTRAWCRGFAEAMVRDSPDRYVATVAKAQRRGRILVDWLRNGLGSTAIASFSPRARPGATVATPLAWREVTATLDPQRFTLDTVPDRLRRQRADPWGGFAAQAQPLPADAFPARSSLAPSGVSRRRPAAQATGAGRAAPRKTPSAPRRTR